MQSQYQQETFQLEQNHWWYRARQRIITSQIQRFLPPSADKTFLDIGCGAGTILHALKDSYHSKGLEQCPEAAVTAQSRSGCEVTCGEIKDLLASAPKQSDGIGLFDVLEHVEKDVDFLQTIKPLFAPHAHLFITVPALQWLFGQHDRVNGHYRRYSRRQLKNTLVRAGFAVDKISYFNSLLAPLLIPPVLLKSWRKSGHNFDVQTFLDPLLESVMGFESHLLPYMSFPVGLSLIAVAHPLFNDNQKDKP